MLIVIDEMANLRSLLFDDVMLFDDELCMILRDLNTYVAVKNVNKIINTKGIKT